MTFLARINASNILYVSANHQYVETCNKVILTSWCLIFYLMTLLMVWIGLSKKNNWVRKKTSYFHGIFSWHDTYCRNMVQSLWHIQMWTYQWFAENVNCQYFILETGLGTEDGKFDMIYGGRKAGGRRKGLTAEQ